MGAVRALDGSRSARAGSGVAVVEFVFFRRALKAGFVGPSESTDRSDVSFRDANPQTEPEEILSGGRQSQPVGCGFAQESGHHSPCGQEA